jgi:glycosyltransferase involved in cell wall biosynthesis
MDLNKFDLSVLIPARNEMFLIRTIEDILANSEGSTEIIVVLDGYWPDPPIEDNPRVTLIHHTNPVGQRAATNEAARLSTAKYVMKVDAHCAFDKGFDVKMMERFEPDWTMIPRMYNLHAFDWVCSCGYRKYQSPTPEKCEKCGEKMKREVIWKPREHTSNDFMRFDSELHFQYWRDLKRRPQSKGDYVETMSLLGACWMMQRDRYWELDGMDEGHGSWGQMGTEVACKSWLSGGKLITNRKTWFAHMFRTQGGDFGFPYPNPGIRTARKRSQDLWKNGQWPKAKYPLSWLIEKFAPVPGWENVEPKKEETIPMVVDDPVPAASAEEIVTTRTGVGMVYYTDNRLDPRIMDVVQKQLQQCCNGHQIISVSLKPIDFGKNITLPLERGYLTMFKQILAGIEACDSEIIFLVEHDVLYHPSHFDFTPPKKDVFYYDENRWFVDAVSGRALFYNAKSTSMLCAYRSLLIEHYRKRVDRVQKEGFTYRLGFEPGNHPFPRGVDHYGSEAYLAKFPSIDIRHGKNLTASRWTKEEFRNKKNLYAWTEADEVPGWGKTRGCFNQIMGVISAIQT